MKARGKKLKGPRGRGAGTSFGELVRKLWQPGPEELKPKVETEKLRKLAAKGKHIRES